MLLLFLFMTTPYYTSAIFTGDAIQNADNLMNTIASDTSGHVVIVDDLLVSNVDLHFTTSTVIDFTKIEIYRIATSTWTITHNDHGNGVDEVEAIFLIKGGDTKLASFRDLDIRGPWDPNLGAGNQLGHRPGGPYINLFKIVNSGTTGLYNGELYLQNCKIRGFSKPIRTSTQLAYCAVVSIVDCDIEASACMSIFGDRGTFLNAYNNDLHQNNDWGTPEDPHNHNLYIHPKINSNIKYNRLSYEGVPARYAIAFNGSDSPTPPADYINVVGNTFDSSIVEGVLASEYSPMVYSGNESSVSGVHLTVQGQNIQIRDNKFTGGDRIIKSEGALGESFYADYTNNIAENVGWFGNLFAGEWDSYGNKFESENTTTPRQNFILISHTAELYSVNDRVRLGWLGVGGKSFVANAGGTAEITNLSLYNKANGAPFVGPVTVNLAIFDGKNGLEYWP